TGDTSADGIDMTIDLRIICRLVAGEVAIRKKTDHQQNDQGDQNRDTKTGTLRARRTSMEVFLAGGQGPRKGFRPIAGRFGRGGRRSLGSSWLHTLIDCLSDSA